MIGELPAALAVHVSVAASSSIDVHTPVGEDGSDETVNVWRTSTAAATLLLPSWLATMMQEPAASMVTVPFDSEQIAPASGSTESTGVSPALETTLGT